MISSDTGIIAISLLPIPLTVNLWKKKGDGCMGLIARMVVTVGYYTISINVFDGL